MREQEYAPASQRTRQAIIQWHESNDERRQENFIDAGPIRHITENYLKVSKKHRFEEEEDFPRGRRQESRNSYKIRPLKQYERINEKTTDIILYGHSTWRGYVHPKGMVADVRGASIAKRFVSASKIAAYLDDACPNAKGVDQPVRIWLMSCHTAGDDIDGKVYASEFARKIAMRGWKNSQVIGFEEAVNFYSTLPHLRQLAEATPLFQQLKFPPILDAYGPKIWMIDAAGKISHAGAVEPTNAAMGEVADTQQATSASPDRAPTPEIPRDHHEWFGDLQRALDATRESLRASEAAAGSAD